METVWQFHTHRLHVMLQLERLDYYQYDGDDEDGSYQRAINSGKIVAFNSRVVITCNGLEIASDWLCGNTYYANEVSQFWTAHRDPDPMNRNCSIMRAAKGERCSIGHYFPDMVRCAIDNARDTLRRMPRVRDVSAADVRHVGV